MGVKWFRLGLIAAVVCVCGLAGLCTAVEKLDRGLIAVRQEDGSVYIGWRLLQSDAKDVGFDLRRAQVKDEAGGVPRTGRFAQYRLLSLGDTKLLNSDPIVDSTNFVDEAPPKGTVLYWVQRVYGRYENPWDTTPGSSVKVTELDRDKSYIGVPFQGKYRAQMVSVADLNGDGKLDYVIKQPDFNVDPYEAPGYWKKSEDTYKIEAYRHNGTFMWRYDMGWAIEEGIWYSPIVVYDIDGDGKAEIYTKAGEGDPRDADGRVQSGPEYLVKIDGETGKVVKKVDWLSREGFERYNYYCRNLLGVAYLDGKKPYLIMERGTYTIIKIAALDADLKQVWYWEASGENRDYRGQGLHGLHAADVDGDGCDELVIGCAAIDHDGKSLWTMKKGHPDVAYVGDVDPDRLGLEVFYGMETRQKEKGVCLVDAKSGVIIWGYDGPTTHVHNQGMCADIIGSIPGMECYAGEKDGSNYWLYDAKGNRLSEKSMGTLSPRPVYWDADPQREVILGRSVRDYEGEEYTQIEGRVIAIVDCLGDWREEIITSVNGELRIYTTTIPAKTRRVCLMQDRKYRTDVAVQSMGYYYPPIEGGVPLP
jgi:rhamnogalacturonan endolyase